MHRSTDTVQLSTTAVQHSAAHVITPAAHLPVQLLMQAECILSLSCSNHTCRSMITSVFHHSMVSALVGSLHTKFTGGGGSGVRNTGCLQTVARQQATSSISKHGTQCVA